MTSMFLKTVRSIALGTLVLNGAIAISASGRTSANTPTANSHLSNRVIQVAQSTSNTTTMEQLIFEQVNKYRAYKGLPALTRNSALDSQSRAHSQNMASGQVSFGHQGFDNRIKATSISSKGASENVAYNQGFPDPATQAIKGWLKSPGHCSNIEGKFNQTGIGAAINSKGEVYFTQIFVNNR
ncbi:MAG: CAP domain-containing protein [Heteroscytonema crispum UTEX LB 1556]